MNAFFDSVESRNAESTEQQYTSDRSGTVGNNYSDVLLDAFESDIADYDRDYDDPDTVESKNQGDSNAVGFGGKIRSLFVPFSRRTVGVILFAIAGVLLVVSLVSMAKTAAVNKKHDSNPTPSEQPTLSGTAIPEGGTPTPRVDGKDTDSTAQPGITKNPNGTPGPRRFPHVRTCFRRAYFGTGYRCTQNTDTRTGHNNARRRRQTDKSARNTDNGTFNR